jgi:hypothetical protein
LVLAAAQPNLDAARTRVAPTIDGRLDDPAWAAAPFTDVFTQHFPDEGARRPNAPSCACCTTI